MKREHLVAFSASTVVAFILLYGVINMREAASTASSAESKASDLEAQIERLNDKVDDLESEVDRLKWER